MSKLDITMHSDEELSLLVFNTESLYKLRHSRYLIDALNDDYDYTDEQLAVLKQDIQDDLEGE